MLNLVALAHLSLFSTIASDKGILRFFDTVLLQKLLQVTKEEVYVLVFVFYDIYFPI